MITWSELLNCFHKKFPVKIRQQFSSLRKKISNKFLPEIFLICVCP
jgi:hypothetical protein